LPQDILDIYTRNIESLFKDEAFTRRIVATGSRPAFLAPASFAELVREDHAYFGNLIRELKIKTSD
jgi:tripartite-type tricarboxylate transporter receptor subunit TctC